MRITEMAGTKGQEEEKSPFDALDLTPGNLNTISDAELDGLYAAVHEIWREQGSKEEDKEAIGASIVINNEYKLRKRELPKKDKLDEISERMQKTAVTGEEGEPETEKEKFISELKELFAKSLPEYDLIIKPKKEGK